MQSYPQDFYRRMHEDAVRAAAHIVPLVLHYVQPASAIDLGCGLGAWLAAFADRGVADIRGVDSGAVPAADLVIPESQFIRHDLTHPLFVHRRFDLALALEVAEHLDAIFAETFVRSLTTLSDIVLFSAAVPYQGGYHHVNEQWPEYWATLFSVRGYVPVDCLRARIWLNPEVKWWFAQNIFFFVRQASLGAYPLLERYYQEHREGPLSLVHPKLFLLRTEDESAISPHWETMAEPAERAGSPPSAECRASFLRAYMISCAERDAVREATIGRYRETDLRNTSLTVIMDVEAIEGQGLRNQAREERQVGATRLALKLAWEDGTEYALFLEDDIDFNVHIRHNLEMWGPLKDGAVTLAGLYNPNVAALSVGESFFVADPHAIYGSQAFLLSRRCIRFILDHWDEQAGLQDIKLSRLAARLECPIYYHVPSLVQHVGVPSTWGGHGHEAADFDTYFRADDGT
jgi:hypothetical protein